MIKRIGTGDSGEPLVLAELAEHEKAALSRILRLAEAHLDEIKAGRIGQRKAVAALTIGALRTVFGIPEPGQKEG